MEKKQTNECKKIKKLIKQTKLSDEEKRKAVLHLQIKQKEGWTADEVQLSIKSGFFEDFAKRLEGLN